MSSIGLNVVPKRPLTSNALLTQLKAAEQKCLLKHKTHS